MTDINFVNTMPKKAAHIVGVAILLFTLLTHSLPAPAQAAGVPDLVITELVILPDLDRPINEDTILRVTFKNQGSAAAGAFYLDAYINDVPPTCATIGDYWKGFSGLAAGAEITYNFKIQIEDINDLDGAGRPWAGPGVKNITVILDYCNNITEVNKTNNTASTSVTISDPPVAAPSNDAFEDAVVIPGLPFNSSMDIRGATLNIVTDKHSSRCNLYRGGKSVWYQFQPDSDTSVIFDTFTSDYDTYIAIWTGTFDNLTEVACNDDAKRTKQSQVGLRMNAGTTYYIQVAEYRFSRTGSAFSETFPYDATRGPEAESTFLTSKPKSDAGALGTVGLLNLHAYIDNIPPVVNAITHGDPSATLGSTVRFIVKFSEDVENVGLSDFGLAKTGTITGESITSVSGSFDEYTVTVNTGSGAGTLKLILPPTATITDIVGNQMIELPYNAGATYKVRVQTFADVPTSYWSWQFIERLYTAGITGGCGSAPLKYCPGNTVTRDQMAIFLLRGINGSVYTPPAVGASTGFADVPTTYWAAAWIKQLAASGITGGCGGGNFCPTSPVTRDQMAIFLLRARYGASYTPPAVGSSTGFTDVPTTYWAAPWIKQLAAEGITGGCGSGKYCPTSPVTRDQMAVFLVRTFGLP